MKERIRQIIQRHCRPLEPTATATEQTLCDLHTIRAVLFDVYGTLLISASGDIGGGNSQNRAAAFASALQAVGIGPNIDVERCVTCFYQTIERQHLKARGEGIDFPEVNICQTWELALKEMVDNGWMPTPAEKINSRQLAVEYEVRVNPVWPMPGMRQCLNQLCQAGIVLGVVSNAQFYTAELFPALLGQEMDDLGLDPDLQFYSYQHERAKPDTYLYELARRALARRGIGSEETLYVGNDMLNDMLPASKLGFHTALFAGDARSLRRREHDPRVKDVVPDIVLTELSALLRCVSPPPPQK